MSLRFYVGNYPSDFTREDVESLFQDFEGIEVDQMIKKNKKCYSFLICKDIDQLVSVIQSMNNASVSGRKLKVRASDESLQEYIMLLLEDASSTVNIDAKSTNSEDINDAINYVTQSTSFTKASDINYGAGSTSFAKANDDINYDAVSEPFIPLQVMRNKCASNVAHPHRQNYVYEHATKEKYQKNGVQNIENSPLQSLNSSGDGTDSYATDYSNPSSAVSQSRNHAKNSFLQQLDKDENVWLSVTNFPIGTGVKSIYELFAEHHPLKVKMICNSPRRDRALTEAHVCFSNQDIADDVILTFDNTFFNGRLILVTDIEDLTIMNELLDVFNS